MSVVLIDDHPMLSMGLRQGLATRGIDAIALAPAPPELLVDELYDSVADPLLIVLDLAMPAVPDTAALVEALVRRGGRVLMLSGSDDDGALARCLLAGAIGVLAKNESLDVILDTIEDAVAGRQIRVAQREERLQQYDHHCREVRSRAQIFEALTKSEQEVLRSMILGQSAATIAANRYVSLATVRTQIKAVLAKMGAGSQLEAVALAHRAGFEQSSQLAS